MPDIKNPLKQLSEIYGETRAPMQEGFQRLRELLANKEDASYQDVAKRGLEQFERLGVLPTGESERPSGQAAAQLLGTTAEILEPEPTDLIPFGGIIGRAGKIGAKVAKEAPSFGKVIMKAERGAEMAPDALKSAEKLAAVQRDIEQANELAKYLPAEKGIAPQSYETQKQALLNYFRRGREQVEFPKLRDAILGKKK